MSITAISSRAFNQDAGGAQKAAEKGLVLMTRNVGDFEPMGVALIDPWRAPSAGTP